MTAEKIYIVGSVASGKSTLAHALSERRGIPCYALDEVVHERHPDGDRKRTPEEIDALFRQILSSEKWIIEDVMRPCFEAGLKEAEQIFLLEVPSIIRKKRILLRWVRQVLGIERAGYKSTVKMLGRMFGWCNQYDRDREAFYQRLEPYREKLVVLKRSAELKRIIST